MGGNNLVHSLISLVLPKAVKIFITFYKSQAKQK